MNGSFHLSYVSPYSFTSTVTLLLCFSFLLIQILSLFLRAKETNDYYKGSLISKQSPVLLVIFQKLEIALCVLGADDGLKKIYKSFLKSLTSLEKLLYYTL